MDSLWGEEFSIKETPKQTKQILKKIKEPKEPKITTEKQIKSKKLSIDEKLAIITEKVNQILGIYKDNTIVIKTKQDLIKYIDKAIENGELAVDTETNNSLDPITCKLMGPCFYTPGMKNAYVPINHIDKDTKERLDWQLTESDVNEQLERLNDVKLIFHNGKFDYQVIKCTCGNELKIFWDTLIGAKMLDENERSAGLKQQYIDKIDPSIEKYSIDGLFEDIEYAIVNPDVFALYAATDAYMTYQLYEWQKEQLEKSENERLYSLFKDIEMPLVPVLAEMEMTGMEIDTDYGKLLSAKYHKKLEDVDEEINKELINLKPQIDTWRLTADANYKPPKKSGEGNGKSKNEQLTDPINLGSPTQLAIFFYDILKAPQVNVKKPRGTGEEELEAINQKLNLNICKLLIKRRELVKLLSTYIDAIPELAKRWPDGRVRTHFNQYGANTGRLSSSDPINFQNIPSHNREIRLLFKAPEGSRIIGADFSGQEPRETAFYSQDENMINAYKEGKDLYAVIASMSFDKPYEDCLEFHPEGTKIELDGKEKICGKKEVQNKAGKERRTQAKAILLGILYGRGAASVGEQIGKTKEEAQEIIDKFFAAFPKVKKWIDETIVNAHKLGYVEDIAGRRRRLPDILLPKYAIKLKNNENCEFNPLLNCKDIIKPESAALIDKYKEKLKTCRNKNDYENLKNQADKEGVIITNNTGFIAQAERQAVNSRVQGGAATLTKAALITLSNDQRLKDLKAKLINTVHDEILMEVPTENSKLAEKYLSEDMVNSAKKYVTNVPMSCDSYNTPCWYLDEFFATVQKEFKELLEGNTDLEAFEKICKIRTESTRDQLYEIVHDYMHNIPENVDTTYKSL